MPITITGIVLFGIALAIYRFTLTDWSTKRLSKNGLVHGVINSIVVALVSIAIGVIGLLILFVGLVVEVLL